MAASFEFRRSTYDVTLDSAGAPLYTTREVVTFIGSSGGNFFNWAGGRPLTLVDNPNLVGYPLQDRGILGDTAEALVFAQYPLLPNQASVEVFLRGYWSGTFSTVSNVRLLCTALGVDGYGEGAYVNGRVLDQYPTGDSSLVGGLNPFGYAGPLWLKPDHPGNSPSVKAPLQQSQDPQQGFLDLTPGSGVAPGTPYSRYGVLQLVTGPNAAPGEGGRSRFALFYDES